MTSTEVYGRQVLKCMAISAEVYGEHTLLVSCVVRGGRLGRGRNRGWRPRVDGRGNYNCDGCGRTDGCDWTGAVVDNDSIVGDHDGSNGAVISDNAIIGVIHRGERQTKIKTSRG